MVDRSDHIYETRKIVYSFKFEKISIRKDKSIERKLNIPFEFVRDSYTNLKKSLPICQIRAAEVQFSSVLGGFFRTAT